MSPTSTPPELWPEVMATVTECHYEFGAGRALAFGMPSSRHFRIRFNYWADDTLHTGEYMADKAVPQGTIFPLTYNPEAPHEHDKAGALPSGRTPVIAVGIIGSVVLSLAWLFILRGCH